ncbi:MAG TPA: hypothetical protein VFQ44_15020 [Streptosporangiaceae bacterium]|nr:hypothetical protein [Streptosporangiaceae bacterium]
MRSRAMRFMMLPSAVVVAAAVLAGCGARGPATNGPLRIHDQISLGSQCVPGGRAQAFGFDQFTNFGQTTVVLDRVVLLHPRNERLVGSYAVPGDRVVGVAHWPPSNPPAQPEWKNRQPVHGFRLAPGKTFNIVLGIAAVAGSRRGISRGELVYYHDSAGSYVAMSHAANVMAADHHNC